jgi:hypothetical protein
MSGFSAQRQQLQQALVAAGLSPDNATAIANILGNGIQQLRHSGPVTVDNTPRDLRYVTKDGRTLRFPNLDFREGDPDYRQKRVEDSEQKPETEPEPNVLVGLSPQQVQAQFRVAPGAFTEVVGNGQAAQVNVRHNVAARPPKGLPLALLDAARNIFVGKAPRTSVGPNDGTASLEIRENEREVVWDLQMLNRADYDVVTGVEYVPGRGLEVTYSKIKAWNGRTQKTDTIPVQRQPVVTEMVDDRKGTRGRRRIIDVFHSRGDSYSYFNTFRIGKFTGGWATGTSKEIEQVWPTTELVANVKNETHSIADTEEEKYVLFAARTKDAVPPPPEDPEDVPEADTIYDSPSPITTDPPLFNAIDEYIDTEPDGVNEPEVEYYALEIQSASQCDAFSSLEGKLASELEGYDDTKPSALSYATDAETEGHPCLKWRSHLATVLTDVALTASGLEFTRKKLYVLAEEPEEPIVIPIEDCPSPSPP